MLGEHLPVRPRKGFPEERSLGRVFCHSFRPSPQATPPASTGRGWKALSAPRWLAGTAPQPRAGQPGATCLSSCSAPPTRSRGRRPCSSRSPPSWLPSPRAARTRAARAGAPSAVRVRVSPVPEAGVAGWGPAQSSGTGDLWEMPAQPSWTRRPSREQLVTPEHLLWANHRNQGHPAEMQLAVR